ncbi:hypothetical protein, partial [Staphylococcus aureus]
LTLVHIVDVKVLAPSAGPYSPVTQLALGGKAQVSGVRFGKIVIWILEANGVAYRLQEILSKKSDYTVGRVKSYESN